MIMQSKALLVTLVVSLALASSTYATIRADIQFTTDNAGVAPAVNPNPSAGQLITIPGYVSVTTGKSVLAQNNYADSSTGATMSGKSAVLSSDGVAGGGCNFYAVIANPADKLTSGIEYVSFDFMYDKGYTGGNAWIIQEDYNYNQLGNGTLTLSNDGKIADSGGKFGDFQLGAVNHLMLKLDMTNKTRTVFMNGGQIGGVQAITGSDFGILLIALASTYNGKVAVDNIYINSQPLCADQWAIGLGMPGDVNKDCKVNFTDFGLMAANWTQCNDPCNPLCPVFVETGISSVHTIYADSVSPGWNATDATDCLENALATGAKRIIVRNMGSPWEITPIRLDPVNGSTEIVFESGVVVEAKAGEFHGANDCLFGLWGVDNITLNGYGATLRMRKSDYQNPALYTPSEFRMAVKILGGHNIVIKGLTIESSGGDGITIAGSTDPARPHSQNITLQDVVCNNHHRQGMSITDVNGLVVQNCIFKNTKGTAPQDGIDIEPDGDNNLIKGVVIDNCQMLDNAGFGLNIGTFAQQGTTQTPAPVDVTVTNCTIQRNAGFGLSVQSNFDSGPVVTALFKNTNVSDCNGAGLYLGNVKSASSITVDNCVFTNNAKTRLDTAHGTDLNPIMIYGEAEGLIAWYGGLSFINGAKVVDTYSRAAIRAMSSNDRVYVKNGHLKNITGNINVSNSNGAVKDLGTVPPNVNVTVTVTQVP